MDHGATRVGAGEAFLGMHETNPFASLEFGGEWHLPFLVVEEIIPCPPVDARLFIGLGLTRSAIWVCLPDPAFGGSMGDGLFLVLVILVVLDEKARRGTVGAIDDFTKFINSIGNKGPCLVIIGSRDSGILSL